MRYEAENPRSPQEWLALDEQERIALVEDYHRRKRVHLPNRFLHAAIHVVVENQLAMAQPEVVRALARLRNEGLERHEAIHAIGSILAGQLRAALAEPTADVQVGDAYLPALEGLTAEKWRTG